MDSKPHPSNVIAGFGEVDSRCCSCKKRNRSRWLNACGFNGLWNRKPIGIFRIKRLNVVITLVHPLFKGIQSFISDKLSNTRHGTTDSSISQHHTVRFGPMGLTQSHGFCVKIGTLQCVHVILKRIVVVREGFHQTTQFKRLKRLLKTRISSHSPSVFEIGFVLHASVFTHILKPSITGFSIQPHPFRRWLIIHTQFSENGIVGSPTVFCTVRIHFVILQVKVFVGIGRAENNFRRSANISCDHTLSNQIHNVHNGGDGNRLPCFTIKNGTDLSV